MTSNNLLNDHVLDQGVLLGKADAPACWATAQRRSVATCPVLAGLS